MKTNFKDIFFLAAFILLFSIISFSNALAQNANSNAGNTKNAGSDKASEAKVEIQARFCEKISDLSSKISERFSQNQERVKTRTQERQGQWEDKINGREAKLADYRSERDANLEEHFQMLEKRAQTETQKNAVNDFEKTVRSAIETRRNALDEAIKTFRNEVKNLQTERQTVREQNMAAFMNSEQTSLGKAKSNCESGANPATVRQTLRTTLTSAKTKFASDKQNRERTRTQMEALIQTRRQAIEKAVNDFKASLEGVKTELKTVFPEN